MKTTTLTTALAYVAAAVAKPLEPRQGTPGSGPFAPAVRPLSHPILISIPGKQTN
jgi:hypothetical protein